MKILVVLCALVLFALAESQTYTAPECQDKAKKEDCDETKRLYQCDAKGGKQLCARTCRVCYKPCEDLKRTCDTTSQFFCRFSGTKKDCPLKCGVCKIGSRLPVNISR